MATGAPAPQPYPNKPAQSDTNVYGIIGLVCGLLGFFITITAPIGLIFSYLGLKHPQNGIAIAGLIISIISTLYAAVMVGILFMYFGAICGTCMCMSWAMSDDMEIRAKVKTSVAEQLEMQPYEVDIQGLSTDPPFGGDSKTFTGSAVYTDETGQQMAVDFSGDAEKVGGEWEVNNVQIEGEPYEWYDPFSDDDFSYDDTFDATMDDSFDAPADGMTDGEFDGAADAVDSETADGFPTLPEPGDGEAADGEVLDGEAAVSPTN